MVIQIKREKLNIDYVKATIIKLAQKLKDEKIPVRKMILFGSYAKNQPHIDSDIDVAIILPGNTNIDRDRISQISWWAKQIEIKLETHILSENDFNNRWFSLPAEIKKSGIEIK